MYICAKGVNFAFVSAILDWIVKLSLQCGIFFDFITQYAYSCLPVIQISNFRGITHVLHALPIIVLLRLCI